MSICNGDTSKSINDQFNLCNSCFREYMKLHIARIKTYPEIKELGNFTEQNQKVLEIWENLIQEINKMIPLAKNRGGTLGHRYGSIRNSLVRMIELIRD